MSSNPSNIKGIYNYCDYWCERCVFTSRCLNFQIETKRREEFSAYTKDENEAFWTVIKENFEMARELLREFATNGGIDLQHTGLVKPLKQATAGSKVKIRKHFLITMGDECIRLSRQWMDEMERMFYTTFDQEKRSISIQPKPAYSDIDIKKVTDAVEVILWYQFQISVKIMRALHNRELVIPKTMEDGTMQNDADGSAKVALIGLDRSIGAWNVLLTNFPKEEDRILQILICLNRLRKATEKEFPTARTFIRPGFDTE